MNTVTFALPDLLELHRLAAAEPFETCAVGFAHQAGEGRLGPRYTVRELFHAPSAPSSWSKSRTGRANCRPAW